MFCCIFFHTFRVVDNFHSGFLPERTVPYCSISTISTVTTPSASCLFSTVGAAITRGRGPRSRVPVGCAYLCWRETVPGSFSLERCVCVLGPGVSAQDRRLVFDYMFCLLLTIWLSAPLLPVAAACCLPSCTVIRLTLNGRLECYWNDGNATDYLYGFSLFFFLFFFGPPLWLFGNFFFSL